MHLGNFDFCNNHNQFFWYDGDELVATVEIKQEKGVKWICGVYVSPTYRRKGLGEDLLRFAILLGGVKLSVRKDNDSALSLYKKCGFQIFDENHEVFFMMLNGQQKGE